MCGKESNIVQSYVFNTGMKTHIEAKAGCKPVNCLDVKTPFWVNFCRDLVIYIQRASPNSSYHIGLV